VAGHGSGGSRSWLNEGQRGPLRRPGVIALTAGLAAVILAAGVLIYVLRPAQSGSGDPAGPSAGAGGRSSAPAAAGSSPAALSAPTGTAAPTPQAVALLLARLLRHEMAGHVIGYGGGTGALPGASRSVTGVVTWLDGRTVSIALSLNWPRGRGPHLDRGDSACSVVSKQVNSHKTRIGPRSLNFCTRAYGGSLFAVWDNISERGLPAVRPWVVYSDTVVQPSGFWVRLTYCSCAVSPGGRETPAAFVNPALLNAARAGILLNNPAWQPTLSRRLVAAGAALPDFRVLPARSLMIVPP
jgi:hypothetical protein